MSGHHKRLKTADLSLASVPTKDGILVKGESVIGVDVYSLRSLYESGMRPTDIAREFKVSYSYVKLLARNGGWLRPVAIEKLRREIESKQAETFKQSGKTRDVSQVKAEIWKERSEQIKEKTFGIIDAALDGVTPDVAKKFIKNPLGLLNTINAARLITGEQDTADNAPKLAVNIGFLRTNKPTPVTVDIDADNIS